MARGKGIAPADLQVGCEEGTDLYQSVPVDVLNQLGEEGIPLPRRPDIEDVELPSNVVTLSDEKLGTLMANLTIFNEYLDGRLHWYTMEVKRIEKELEIAESTAWKGAEGPKEAKTHTMRLDRRVVECSRELLKFQYLKEMLKAAVAAKKRDFTTVSRIVTQRTDQGRMGNRSHNVGNRRVPRGPGRF